MRSLNRHKSGEMQILVLSSASIEVRSVLYSRGLNQKKIEDFFSLVAAMLEEYSVVDFVPVKPSDVIIAERLRTENSDLTFFDSLHAATSKRLGIKLLSSEGIYSRIGIQVIDLDTL